jgi:hypothetical protein
MTWLVNFLGIEAPENTALHAAELGLRGGASWPVVTLAVLAAMVMVVLTFLLYFTERGRLSLGRIFLALLSVPLLGFAMLLVLLVAVLLGFPGVGPGMYLALLGAELCFLLFLALVVVLAWREFPGARARIAPVLICAVMKTLVLLVVIVLHALHGDQPLLLVALVSGALLYQILLAVVLLALPRFFLPLVRIALVCFLLLLLLRPVLLLEFHGERARGIALLLDDTKSMKQVDRRTSSSDQLRLAIAKGLVEPNAGPEKSALLIGQAPEAIKDAPRVELVKAVLGNNKLNLLARLKERGPLRAYLFGEDLRSELEEKTAEGAARDLAVQLQQRLTAEQNKTALGDALLKLVGQAEGDLPAAVVVVTDGLNNAGSASLAEAALECQRAGVPLYIYGVGSSEGGTLQLIDVAAPETIFYDDIVSVPVRWKAQGFKKGTLQIKVLLGGKEVARKDLPLKTGQDLREVLTFTPRKADQFLKQNLDLKVLLQVKDSPEYQDDMKKPVRLSDSKVKVLYVENVPRWEYKFLQTVLLRDRRIQARFLLIQGDPRLTKSEPFLPSFPTREELLKYDLVILGDVPAGYLGKDRLEWLREFVRDFRGGLITIAGRQHMPSSYADTLLAEVLPVEFLPARFKIEAEQRPFPYHAKLTKAGERSPMLLLGDTPEESLKIWEQLPGFYWNYPVTKLRPAGTALLVHPSEKMGEKPMPLLATQYYGRGQVLFVATDETWRWRYNVEEKYHTRFWGQVIYQLALPHLLGDSSRRVQVVLERSEAVLDREGYIYARLLDKEFRPLRVADVPAELEHLDAGPGQERTEPVMFQSIPGRPGEYRLFRKHAQPGRFEVRFKLPGQDINSSFDYRVKLPPRHELEKAGLAEIALREAASISGGRFYREEDLHRLPAEIPRETTPYTLHQEVLLWNPLAFLIFLGLITVEWTVRKFSNLS